VRGAFPAAGLLFLLALPAAAQERPGETELFGAPAPEEKPAQPAPAAEPAPRADAPALARERVGAGDELLQLGGTLYLRSSLAAAQDQQPAHWAFTSPSLLDLYLDARPNDRVRGFALARTFYDATQPAGGSAPAATLAAGPAAGANPRALLDQLWLRFDVDRTAFLTVGKQHVKWGVGRFWNPSDFLHATRRDPLATFDDRAGTSMVKVHLPWEKRGWNLYAFAIAEQLVRPARPFALPAEPVPGLYPRDPDWPFNDPGAGRSSSELGAVGGALRAEVVLGQAELGVGAMAQRGAKPRLAADFSTGLWEIDLRGEVAVRFSPDVDRLRLPEGVDPLTVAGLLAVRRYQPRGPRTAAVLSADWSHKYSDEDAFTVGAEYFFNENGYGSAALYPYLASANLLTPFYLGRHYAAAYLLLPQPGSWNLHTVTLSALANASDRTALLRLDWSYVLLTHLTLEAYLAGHLGRKGGEFRFAARIPGPLPGSPDLLDVPAPVADVGLNLRLKL